MANDELVTERLASLREHSDWLFFVGIALVALGAVCVAAPMVTAVAAGILVGCLALVHGIAKLILAFKAKSWAVGILGFIVGLLSIVVGLLILAHPVFGLNFLLLLLSLYLIAEGVIKCIRAVMLRPVRGWVWLLVGGVLTCLLGALIWTQHPVAGAWVLGTFVGIGIILDGSSLVLLAWDVHKLPEAAAREDTSSPPA
jgi:uncharacterized membrane protein HdeD (DUF308 family)